MMAIGYWCFLQLKIEAYPDIADTNVIIVSQYPGRAAEEVEQQVTVPLNAPCRTPACAGQTKPDDLWPECRAANVPGWHGRLFCPPASVGTPESAQLPGGVSPELAPLSTPWGEIFRYVVEGPPSFTPTDLRDLQDWVIKPYLLQLPVWPTSQFRWPTETVPHPGLPEKLRRYD